jgi:hypothetical protein
MCPFLVVRAFHWEYWVAKVTNSTAAELMLKANTERRA